jgi:hypothetical protein
MWGPMWGGPLRCRLWASRRRPPGGEHGQHRECVRYITACQYGSFAERSPRSFTRYVRRGQAVQLLFLDCFRLGAVWVALGGARSV